MSERVTGAVPLHPTENPLMGIKEPCPACSAPTRRDPTGTNPYHTWRFDVERFLHERVRALTVDDVLRIKSAFEATWARPDGTYDDAARSLKHVLLETLLGAVGSPSPEAPREGR